MSATVAIGIVALCLLVLVLLYVATVVLVPAALEEEDSEHAEQPA